MKKNGFTTEPVDHFCADLYGPILIRLLVEPEIMRRDCTNMIAAERYSQKQR